MGKKFYLFLIVFVLSSNFLVFTSLTSIRSETENRKEIKSSLKSSSFEDFRRIIGEFRVNYYIDNDQKNPSICALSNDTIAVAWSSNFQDGSKEGIYARVFDATTGNNVTREFRANYYTTNNQGNNTICTHSICALSNNKFVVAWEGEGQSDTYGVYARVFNATTGNNVTREFRANYYTTNNQGNPSICALSNNDFVVAWEGAGPSDSNGVYASVFDATTGKNKTREFRANYYTTNNQGNPSICALSNNKFAIAWEGAGPSDSNGVYASVFDATGNNVTREFRVNYNTNSEQSEASICALSKDTFAIAWKSWDSGSTYNIYSKIFNANTGNNKTRDFLANSHTDDIQEKPSVCALSNDTIIVAWDSELQDGDYQGIYARIFNATTGNSMTQEIQINYCTTGNQDNPSICALSNDTIAVAWQSSPQDGSNSGVYASIFGPLKVSAGVVDSGDDDDDNDNNGKKSTILDKILNFIKTPIGIGVVVGTIILLIAICIIIKKR